MMTIVGYAHRSDGGCRFWGDSEFFVCKQPSGHKPKVAIGVHAVGGGTGYVALIEPARQAVIAGMSLDEAIAALPTVLMAAQRALIEDGVQARAPSAPWQAYAVAGYSRKHGRVLGAVFDAKRGFNATVQRRFLAPVLRGEGAIDGIDGVVAVAQRQLAALRLQIPSATGGTLSIATIDRGGGISGPTCFDLVTGRMLSRPPVFAEDLGMGMAPA